MAGEDSVRSPAAPVDLRLSYDDFLLFPDDGKRHEILNSTPCRCSGRSTAVYSGWQSCQPKTTTR